MAKKKSVFVCTQCGTQHSKWMGQCQGCKEWNTLVEEIEVKSKPDPRAWSGDSAVAKPIRIEDVEHTSVQRFPVPDYEFARVLGGGVVPGSVTLLGGEPGIGKSTLLLQLALSFTGTVAATTDASNNEFFIGNNSAGTSGLNGYVAEVILFNKTLSATEYANVENYLSNKWGL